MGRVVLPDCLQEPGGLAYPILQTQVLGCALGLDCNSLFHNGGVTWPEAFAKTAGRRLRPAAPVLRMNSTLNSFWVAATFLLQHCILQCSRQGHHTRVQRQDDISTAQNGVLSGPLPGSVCTDQDFCWAGTCLKHRGGGQELRSMAQYGTAPFLRKTPHWAAHIGLDDAIALGAEWHPFTNTSPYEGAEQTHTHGCLKDPQCEQ